MAAERFLSLRIADLPMVLLLAVRTTEVGQLAVPLAEILADPEFAAACHHATGGNPFLLEQLVSEVLAEGIEPTEASAERVSSLGPDTVRASVLLRLERLPSAGGPVARALAILGEHDIALRDVATLADVPEDAAAEALAELERSYPYGVVRQTADSVQLDKSDEERAALFTGAARLALPILDPASAEESDSPELMYQRLHGL